MAERDKLEIPEKYVGKKIYSISRLQSFDNCEYGYYLNYVKKCKGTPNIYSYLGTKIHDLLESLQVGTMTNDEASKKFKQYLIECEMHDYKFPSDKVKQNFTESISNFLTTYKPMDVKKVTLEKLFFTDIFDEEYNKTHVLMGYIDAIIQNHDETIEVIDYKTSSKYTSKDLDEHAMQLILYAYALEKEYNVKVNKVKWNMLKYCWIRWKGKTKEKDGTYKIRERFSQRNEVIKSMTTELKKDLKDFGYPNIKIEMMLEEASKSNDLKAFPKEIQDKYEISDGFVEYPYNDTTKQMLMNYVSYTIMQIENKPVENEEEWTAKEITEKESFFCSVLCDHSSNCKFYKKYLEDNAENFKQKENKDEKTLTLKSLFG